VLEEKVLILSHENKLLRNELYALKVSLLVESVIAKVPKYCGHYRYFFLVFTITCSDMLP